MSNTKCKTGCGFYAGPSGYCSTCERTAARKAAMLLPDAAPSPPLRTPLAPVASGSWRSSVVDVPRAIVRSLPPLCPGDAVVVRGDRLGVVTAVEWKTSAAGVSYQVVSVAATSETLATTPSFALRGLARLSRDGIDRSGTETSLVYGRPVSMVSPAASPTTTDGDLVTSAGRSSMLPGMVRGKVRPTGVAAGTASVVVPTVQLTLTAVESVRSALSSATAAGAGAGGGDVGVPLARFPAPAHPASSAAGEQWVASASWAPVSSPSSHIVPPKHWLGSPAPDERGEDAATAMAPLRQRAWPPSRLTTTTRAVEAEVSPAAVTPVVEVRDTSVNASFGRAWVPVASLQGMDRFTSLGSEPEDWDEPLLDEVMSLSASSALPTGEGEMAAVRRMQRVSRQPYIGLPDDAHEYEVLPLWQEGYGTDSLMPVRPLAQPAALAARVVEGVALNSLLPPTLLPAVASSIATVVVVTVAGRSLVTAPRFVSASGVPANPVWWHPRMGCDVADALDALSAARESAAACDLLQGHAVGCPASLAATGGAVVLPLRRGGGLSACGHGVEDEVVDAPVTGVQCACQAAWYLHAPRSDDAIAVTVWTMPPADVPRFRAAVRDGAALEAAVPSACPIGRGQVRLSDARPAAAPPPPLPSAIPAAAAAGTLADADRDALAVAVTDYMQQSIDAKTKLAGINGQSAISALLSSGTPSFDPHVMQMQQVEGVGAEHKSDEAVRTAWRTAAVMSLTAREHIGLLDRMTGGDQAPAAPAAAPAAAGAGVGLVTPVAGAGGGAASDAGVAPARPASDGAPAPTELAEAIAGSGLMLSRDDAFMGLTQAEVAARLQAEGALEESDNTRAWCTPPPWRAATPWNPIAGDPVHDAAATSPPPLLDPDAADVWVPLVRVADGRTCSAAVRLHLRVVKRADACTHVGTGESRRPLVAWIAAAGLHTLLPLVFGLGGWAVVGRKPRVHVAMWSQGVGSDGLTALEAACAGSTNDHHRAMQAVARLQQSVVGGARYVCAGSQPMLSALLMARTKVPSAADNARVAGLITAAACRQTLVPSRTTMHFAVLGGNMRTIQEVAKWHAAPHRSWRSGDGVGLDPLALAIKLGRVRVASWVLGEAAWSSPVAPVAAAWMSALVETWGVCAVYAGEAGDRAVFRALVDEATAVRDAVSAPELSKLCSSSWKDWWNGSRRVVAAGEFELGQSRVRNDHTWRLGPAPVLQRSDSHGTPLLFHLVACLQPAAVAWWLQMGGGVHVTTDAWGVSHDTVLHVAVRAAMASLPPVPPCDDALLRRYAVVLGLLKAAGVSLRTVNAAGQTAATIATAGRHLTAAAVLALVYSEADAASGLAPGSGAEVARAPVRAAYAMPSFGLAGVVARAILALTWPFSSGSTEAREDPGALRSPAHTAMGAGLMLASPAVAVEHAAGVSPLAAWTQAHVATPAAGFHSARSSGASSSPLLSPGEGIDASPVLARLMTASNMRLPPAAHAADVYTPPRAAGLSRDGTSGSLGSTAAGVGASAPSELSGSVATASAVTLATVDISDGVYVVPEAPLTTLRLPRSGERPASDGGFAPSGGPPVPAELASAAGGGGGVEESKEDGRTPAAITTPPPPARDDAPLSGIVLRVQSLMLAVGTWPVASLDDPASFVACSACGHTAHAAQMWNDCPRCHTSDSSEERRIKLQAAFKRIDGVVISGATDSQHISPMDARFTFMSNNFVAAGGAKLQGSGADGVGGVGDASAMPAPLPPRHAEVRRADAAFAQCLPDGEDDVPADRVHSRIACMSGKLVDASRRREAWRFALLMQRACGVAVPAGSAAAARHVSRLSYHALNHMGNVDDAAEAVLAEVAKHGSTAAAAPDSPDEEEMCPACMEDLPARDMLALPCGHRFCVQCWGGALDAAVNSVGSGCITSTVCMAAPECTCPVDEWIWLAAATPASLARYRKWVMDAFVARQRHLRRCTNPAGCGRVFDVSGLAVVDAAASAPRIAWRDLLVASTEDVAGKVRVHAIADAARALVEPLSKLTSPATHQPLAYTLLCDCGFLSCSHCDLGGHAPALCDAVAVYRDTSSRITDSASLSHMTSSYKRCPSCNVFISKNGGCRHMSCSSCHHQFCWFCGSDWTGYGHRCPYWGRGAPRRAAAWNTAAPTPVPAPGGSAGAAGRGGAGGGTRLGAVDEGVGAGVGETAEVVTVLPASSLLGVRSQQDAILRLVEGVSRRVGLFATAQTQVMKRLQAFGGPMARSHAVAAIMAAGGAEAAQPALLPSAPFRDVLAGKTHAALAELVSSTAMLELDARGRGMALLFAGIAHRGIVQYQRSQAGARGARPRPAAVPRPIGEAGAPALFAYITNNGRRTATDAYNNWGTVYLLLLHTSQWLVATNDKAWLAALQAGSDAPLLQTNLPPLLRAAAMAQQPSTPSFRGLPLAAAAPASAPAQAVPPPTPSSTALPHMRSDSSMPSAPMEWLTANAEARSEDAGPVVMYAEPASPPSGGAGAGAEGAAAMPAPVSPDEVAGTGRELVLLPLWALNSTAALVYLRMRATAAGAWSSITYQNAQQVRSWLYTAVATGVCTNMLGNRSLTLQPWFMCATCLHGFEELDKGRCHQCGAEGGGQSGGGGGSAASGQAGAAGAMHRRPFPQPALSTPSHPHLPGIRAREPEESWTQEAKVILPAWASGTSGCCLSCAMNCHAGHQLVYMGLHTASCTCPRGANAATAVVACASHQQWRSASDSHRAGFGFSTESNRVARRVKPMVKAVGGCLGVAAPLQAYLRLTELSGSSTGRAWNPTAFCIPRNLASAALFTTDAIRAVYVDLAAEMVAKQQESMRAARNVARLFAAAGAASPSSAAPPSPAATPTPTAVRVDTAHPMSLQSLEHGAPATLEDTAHQAQVLACLTVLHSLMSFLQWLQVRRIFPLSTDVPRAALLSHQADLLQHEVETLFSILCAEPAPPPSSVDAKAALAHTVAALRLCSAWMQ